MSGAPALRFLADESCDFAVVRALRDAGHDVLSVAEFTRQSDDGELIVRTDAHNARMSRGFPYAKEPADAGFRARLDVRAHAGKRLAGAPRDAHDADVGIGRP